jgi:hypothetical protein
LYVWILEKCTFASLLEPFLTPRLFRDGRVEIVMREDIHGLLEGQPWRDDAIWKRYEQRWLYQDGWLVPQGEPSHTYSLEAVELYLSRQLRRVPGKDWRRVYPELDRKSAEALPGLPDLERRGDNALHSLALDFIELPVLAADTDEDPPSSLLEAYSDWLWKWGSLGLFFHLYEPVAGFLDQAVKNPRGDAGMTPPVHSNVAATIKDRRTDRLICGEEVLAMVEERFTSWLPWPLVVVPWEERIRLADMSREVVLLKAAIEVAAGFPGSSEAREASSVLYPYLPERLRPSFHPRDWPGMEREVLGRWLDLNHTSYLSFQDLNVEAGRTLRWRHTGLLGAMYHAHFFNEVAGGREVRRCQECGRLFRPKRDADFCSETCSNTAGQRRRRRSRDLNSDQVDR